MQYIEHIGYISPSGVKTKIESISYYPFHIHDNDIEIICVLNGRVHIWDSAASYDLSHGDVHIFNKENPHKILSDDPDNIVLTVQIDCSHYAQYFSDIHDAYFICDTYRERDLYATDIKYLRFHLARLYYAYIARSSDLRLETFTQELLGLLVSQFQQYVYKTDEGNKAHIVRLQNYDKIYKNFERMYRIVDYVSDHYNEKLSLQRIADMEYLSVSYLSKYIKETLGLTFSQLVSLTRCEQASNLLASTNHSVNQIAETVGFSNRQHLAAQFKRWYGKTPTEYRNAILEDLSSNAKIQLNTFDYEFAKIILNVYLYE